MDYHKKLRQTKLTVSTPQADPKEVEDLLDLLFKATKANNSQCARLLGVSTPTWKKWAKEPPTAWY